MAKPSPVKIVLAADIGGTHSRFALFRFDTSLPLDGGGLILVRKATFATTASDSTAAMMRALISLPGDDGGFFTPLSPEPVAVDTAVFGVPGPTSLANPALPPRDEVCVCPNIAWPLEVAPVAAALSGTPVRFINDFVANGFACAVLPHLADATVVLPGKGKPGFPRAVIGAGTGLGHCLILPGQAVSVVGSEAGHTLFPFAANEADLARHYAESYGVSGVDGDQAIAGRGLAVLYEYVTGEKHGTREVFPLAAKNSDVLALAARLYGRAVKHYVLSTLALGGVFITGGLAANLPGVLAHPAFVNELRGEHSMRHILEPVPVFHVQNRDVGLWGAAACAALSLNPG